MLSLVSEKTKLCPKCKEEKYFSQFGKDSTKKIGLSSYCKSCSLEKRKKLYSENREEERIKRKSYYERNKGKSKGYSLKNLYGLTVEQFANMKALQNYSCKICKTHESNLKRKLFVDHCHETGKIRGLLCQSCNTMIGTAKDNVLVLQAGIDYLSGKA